ncbi:hypothetical protein [Francisella philomiragia]|uniref:Putative membrane protein n=1 Tax=Francisella philomiragia TaxID=28110 RepID=A0A0B6CVW8_9GAMM|nr:hypothetical protein [Francisella philomiragia]AJI52950.1 putative membrane protein [Francisella philomiragia]
MQTATSFLDAHPYVLIAICVFIIVALIVLYVSILGWCVHTVQNPNSGFFKKGLAIIVGMLLFKNILNYMNGKKE